MPRITIPPEDSLSNELADIAAQWKANGSDPTFVRMLSYRADVAPAYFSFYSRLRDDGLLPAKVKELARLRIAALNTCKY
jgi:alkylhydroperoxidase family enzyme